MTWVLGYNAPWPILPLHLKPGDEAINAGGHTGSWALTGRYYKLCWLPGILSWLEHNINKVGGVFPGKTTERKKNLTKITDEAFLCPSTTEPGTFWMPKPP
jgi:hypothetical protein